MTVEEVGQVTFIEQSSASELIVTDFPFTYHSVKRRTRHTSSIAKVIYRKERF